MAHGRYTIVGKLADGGMAEIFLAMQNGAEGFQKPVVLKRVLSAFSADQQFRNMFLDEAHISMSLAHGNIVQVLDVGVSGGRTFLVLELVEGWDLEQIMERAQATGPDHPWPPSLALYVTAQICRGLAYAHNKRALDGRPLGIVHRDVSPNNVLISEQGEVKLADFGIAKAERKREQTLAGVIKGKVGFMSPEQALGRGLDARADLFSVGTVLYLMLTGQKPFEAPSELESMMKAQRGEYRSPEELNPYLSKDVVAIVNRAMRADPIARYQTAEQMLIDVERVLRAEYKSAGQTELKTWLAELTRRDGVLPIGRTRPPPESAGDAGGKPLFIDEAGDLSAGTSVELSDIDGSSSPTAVSPAPSVPPAPSPPGMVPVRARIGDGLPPVPSDLREILGPHGAVTAVAPPRKGSAPIAATPTPAPRYPPEAAAGADTRREAIEPTLAGDTAAPPETRTVPPATASGPTISERRPARRGRVGLGFILGAICMLGAVFGIRWLAQWAGRERPIPPGAAQSASETADAGTGVGARTAKAPVAAQPATPGSATTPSAAGTAVDAPDGGAQGAPDAGPMLASANPGLGADAAVGGAPDGAALDDDDDEDRLLGRVRPDAAAVIGEDEAEEGAAPAATAAGAGGAKKAAGKAAPVAGKAERTGGKGGEGEKAKPEKVTRAAAKSQPVQVRITTSPLGAVVRTKKQVLGRTPLAIRFNPGNTYELTFVKSGYVTNRRRLSVAAGKPQSISVPMRKTPPRRSFFGR